jgi:hypothetical protein
VESNKETQKTSHKHSTYKKTHRSWARSNTEKLEVFAAHLVNVFSPPQQQNNNDADIEDVLPAPHQLTYPINAFSLTEVLQELNY